DCLRSAIERTLIDEAASFSEAERLVLCDLDTCLNYFEFVLYLESEKQISFDDRDALFHYWYSWMAEKDRSALRMYIARFDYDRLCEELRITAEPDAFGPPDRRIAVYGTLLRDDALREIGIVAGELE